MNASWKDQLTAFNGNAITYDAIGNPLTYEGATYTWQGRRLTGYAKGSNMTARASPRPFVTFPTPPPAWCPVMLLTILLPMPKAM